MRHLLSLFSSSAGAAFGVLFSLNAAAHIELIEPMPRYTLPANKSCPCGDGDSTRQCRDTAEESTDPNRSENVTTFEAGEVITVRAEEYIDHAGRMRVAFDPEGAELADFNDNILADEADPRESGLSEENPRVWEFEITLPTTPCDNCTLQVIQVMAGGTENPVMDPAPLSTYYTCADIRIVAPEATAASAPAALESEDAEVDDDGMCAFTPSRPGRRSLGALVALGSAFVALGLRRRR